jgi:hypothetical protein
MTDGSGISFNCSAERHPFCNKHVLYNHPG